MQYKYTYSVIRRNPLKLLNHGEEHVKTIYSTVTIDNEVAHEIGGHFNIGKDKKT